MGHRVIGVDLVEDRLRRVAQQSIDVVDLTALDGTSVGDAIRAMTGGPCGRTARTRAACTSRRAAR